MVGDFLVGGGGCCWSCQNQRRSQEIDTRFIAQNTEVQRGASSWRVMQLASEQLSRAGSSTFVFKPGLSDSLKKAITA